MHVRLVENEGAPADADTNLDQFYVNLDTMEEYLDQQQQQQPSSESLRFEGIDEKLAILRDFETELARGDALVEAQQMTMALGELEHVRERIAHLRALIQVGDRVLLHFFV